MPKMNPKNQNGPERHWMDEPPAEGPTYKPGDLWEFSMGEDLMLSRVIAVDGDGSPAIADHLGKIEGGREIRKALRAMTP